MKAVIENIVRISPPKFGNLRFELESIAPYMQARFSKKAEIMQKMASGSTAKSKKHREARDYDKDCEEAMYVAEGGWNGIPASAFRKAIISACRLVNFKMTLAKLSVFIEADGFDAKDGTPLVRITGEPERCDMHVRNATGVVDIRSRPLWRKWTASLRIRFDSDQFSEEDIANLISRVGLQVGVGEGRPDSKDSAGLGYGLFLLRN
jgi:hypothetical protein